VQTRPAQGTFLSPLFCVPKRPVGKRPCLDLRGLNVSVLKRHFKLESLSTAFRLLQQGDFMVKIDIKDAYLLRFNIREETFEFLSLCFGLSSAPWIFTRLTKPMVKQLRLEGIRLVIYLDDLLVMASSPELLRQHLRRVLQLLISLGWVINWAKSELEPSQRRTFLGASLDSQTMTVSLPPEKISRLREQVTEMFDLHHTGQLTLRRAARILGAMTAAAVGISLARLHQRPLLDAVRPLLQAGTAWDSIISLPSEVLEACAWWLAEFRQWNGIGLIPRDPTCCLTTDASETARGATIEVNDLKLRSQFTMPPGQEHRSSNWRELSAINLALRRYGSLLTGQVLEIRSDNWTALRCIANQGSPAPQLTALAVQIWEQASRHQIHLLTTFIPGVENVEADQLSRWVVDDASGYQLHPAIFAELHRHWGPLSEDLFASETNHLLPRFFSWTPAPSAAGLDCFRHQWAPRAFAHPHPHLILRVLEKIRRDGVQSLVLVAPTWPSAPWWPLLRPLATTDPIPLETIETEVLVPCGNAQPPQDFRKWRLQAWQLSAPRGPPRA
jgi:hypothetical protein